MKYKHGSFAVKNVNKKACFVVDGNIGAGKSTFLRMLQQQLDVHVVYEPCDKWQKVVGDENLLENFYRDTPRWAYTFQSYAFITRVLEQEQHAYANAQPIHVLERSVFSDRYCFAKNCHEMGLMSTLEWKLYQEWFNWLVDNYVQKPDGFIYLRVDPKVCHERLVKRNRQEETGVAYDYLKKLHDKHEDWLVNKIDVAPYIQNTPVLTLNCNEDFEHNSEELIRHIEQVVNFVADLVPTVSSSALWAENALSPDKQMR